VFGAARSGLFDLEMVARSSSVSAGQHPPQVQKIGLPLGLVDEPQIEGPVLACPAEVLSSADLHATNPPRRTREIRF
jgi:hypothetical protein